MSRTCASSLVSSPSSETALSAGTEQYHLGWKAAAAVVAFGVSLLLVSLGGDTRSLTYHEVIFAQPAKEMLATGNWVLPKFVGVPCTHKPPGTYWVLASVMALTGSEAEGVLRIPSALAGVATAVLVALLAARWFGQHVGLLAGLMQLTTYYVLQLARLAECDMLMIAAVTGAMGVFAAVHIDSPRGKLQARWAPWLFYLCVTLAFFFKWLIGPVLIFSGCLAHVAVNRDWRGLRFLLNPVGIAVCLTSVLVWAAAAHAQYPQILQDQLTNHFGRFQGEMGTYASPLFYVYSVPLITLPWTPLIIWGAVQTRRLDPHAMPWLKFAACWALPGLVFLSLSRFKHAHYAAPLMPPLTFVAALGLSAYLRSRLEASKRSHLALAAASIAGCIVGAAIIGLSRLPASQKQIVIALVGVAALGALVIPYFQFRRWPLPASGTLFAMAWLLIAGVLGLVMPHHDSYREQTALAGRVNQAVPPDQGLCLVKMPAKENQITFYLQTGLRRYDRVEEFAEALPTEAESLFILAPVEIEPQLAQHGVLEQLDTAPARGKVPSDERLVLYKLTPPLVADAGRGRTPR